MLPRDKQGVVDPELKVYGTSNVRVVDISIIPLHITAHTQSDISILLLEDNPSDLLPCAASAYVIGEKGQSSDKYPVLQTQTSV